MLPPHNAATSCRKPGGKGPRKLRAGQGLDHAAQKTRGLALHCGQVIDCLRRMSHKLVNTLHVLHLNIHGFRIATALHHLRELLSIPLSFLKKKREIGRRKVQQSASTGWCPKSTDFSMWLKKHPRIFDLSTGRLVDFVELYSCVESMGYSFERPAPRIHGLRCLYVLAGRKKTPDCCA